MVSYVPQRFKYTYLNLKLQPASTVFNCSLRSVHRSAIFPKELYHLDLLLLIHVDNGINFIRLSLFQLVYSFNIIDIDTGTFSKEGIFHINTLVNSVSDLLCSFLCIFMLSALDT